MPQTGRRPCVLVVGAGIAGLSCASALHEAGLDVRVVEKSRGTGGRAGSRRHDAFGPIDLGAQFMTARDPRFAARLDAARDAGHAALWTARIAHCSSEGREPATRAERWVGVPGMSGWAASLFDRRRIAFETRVGALARSPDGAWTADALPGERFTAVVLAIPAPQASALLGPHDELGAWLALYAMEPCWAVAAAFSEAVSVPFDGAFVRGGPLSWVARNGSKPGRPAAAANVWTLHAAPSYRRDELVEPELAARELLAAFAALSDAPLPEAVWQTAHLWRYASPAAGVDASGPIWDASRLIGACGDWAAGGRVEGAFLSGLALAARIMP